MGAHRTDAAAGAPPWWPVAVAGAAALLVGLALSPDRPSDDAAILLRYAERLGTGHGLTYNDHERVLGSSSGLWTLLLGGLRAVGLPVVGTALALGVALGATSVALATRLAQHLGGLGAAALAAVALTAQTGYLGQTLSGLETGLAAVLALGAVLAVRADREALAGVLVGLALWNKLDAAALLVAVAGAWWWARGAAPRRLVGLALVVVAPYLVACWAWFGSPVPRSAVTKVTGGADGPGWTWDPTWALRDLVGLAPAVPVALLAVVLARRRGGGPGPASVLALAGWAGLHLAAVSLVPAGGTYPWYLAPGYVAVAVLAGVGAARAAGAARRGPVPRRAVAAALVGGAVLAAGYPVATAGVDTPPSADDVLFDQQLPEAVAWLRPRVAPGEVIRSCYGGVALAFPDQAIDDLCGLASRRPAGPVDWEVTHLVPGSEPRPGGRCLAHVTAADPARPGARRVVVLASGPADGAGRCR